jgi:D-amino peptidase
MKTVLLIADLEGISGVESIEDLVVGAPGYPRAAQRMTDEVALVARLLRTRGVQRVRISDAHRSGAPSNLDPSALPEWCEVRVTDDLYGGALLEGVDAVACVGMHASGTSAGFGAHTVSLHTAWSLGGIELTETRVAQWLAAERGVPLWFSAGDDVLQAQLGDVPFVLTKRSRSRHQTTSLQADEVEAAFGKVLEATPVLASPTRAPLDVRFQRVVEADAAEAAGAARLSPTTIRVEVQETFAAQYESALRFIEPTEAVMLSAIAGLPGTARFARNAAALLVAPWE